MKLRCERHGVTLAVDETHPNQWEAHVDRGTPWPGACGLLTAIDKHPGELRVLDQNGEPLERACAVREVD